MFFFEAKAIPIVVATIVICILGVISYQKIPINLYPNTSPPIIEVYLDIRSTPPRNFMEQFGRNIELSLRTIDGVTDVIGSYDGANVRYSINFGWHVDYKKALSDVQTVFAEYSKNFPQEWGYVFSLSADSMSIFNWFCEHDNLSLAELYYKLSEVFFPKLQSIPNVFSVVSIYLGQMIAIKLKPELLLQYGIDPSTVKKVLLDHQFNKTLGQKESSHDLASKILQVKKSKTLEDIKNTFITVRSAHPIFLKDIADVFLQEDDQLYTKYASGINNNAINVMAKIPLNANLANINHESNNIINNVLKIIPGLKITTLLDPYKEIEEAIGSFKISLLTSIMLSIIIIFLFSGSLQHTLVIGLSIPISLFITIMLISACQLELNLLSLSAASLSSGMVSDASVIIISEIMLVINSAKNSFSDYSAAVAKALRKSWKPIFASTLTNIVVFIPLVFTANITAALLKDFAIVCSALLIASAIVAFTIVPTLANIIKLKPVHDTPYLSAKLFKKIYILVLQFYIAILKFSLTKRYVRFLILSIVSTMLLISGYILTADKIRVELLPTPISNEVLLNLFYNQNYSLDESKAITKEYFLKVKDKFSNYAEFIYMRVQPRIGRVGIILKDKSQAKTIEKELGNMFKKDSIVTRITSKIRRFGNIGIPNPPLLQIEVSQLDEQKSRATLQYLVDKIQENAKIGDIEFMPALEQLTQLNVKIDQEKLQSLKNLTEFNGLSEESLTDLISAATSKLYPLKLDIDKKEMRVALFYPEDYTKRQGGIENILIPKSGTLVPIRSIANFEKTKEWQSYYSENGKELYVLRLWVKDQFQNESNSIRDEILSQLKNDSNLPFNKLIITSDNKETKENIDSLAMALGLSILLLIIILSFQFASINIIIVLTAIPMALSGAFLSLYFLDGTLSLNSMLALLILAGTSVNNSLIFVDAYEADRLQYNSLYDAMIYTAMHKFEPIAVTSLSNIVGMLPLAFSMGSDGELMQSLGIALCGGTIVSTIGVLFIAPIALFITEKKISTTAAIVNKAS